MSPAGSYPAGPWKGTLVSCLGLLEPCIDTPPGPHLRINYFETPLIPRDTPVTKKGCAAYCQGSPEAYN